MHSIATLLAGYGIGKQRPGATGTGGADTRYTGGQGMITIITITAFIAGGIWYYVCKRAQA